MGVLPTAVGDDAERPVIVTADGPLAVRPSTFPYATEPPMQSTSADTTPAKAADLAGGGSVANSYRHVSKVITFAEDLRLPGAYLKWYDLRRADLEIIDEERRQARDFLSSAELSFDDELGFVILHKCTPSFSFLLVQTWRCENELWQTVYAKDGGPFHLHAGAGSHRGTFCVWELAAVWHESRAWSRYLSSDRDNSARKTYVEDRFSGTV